MIRGVVLFTMSVRRVISIEDSECGEQSCAKVIMTANVFPSRTWIWYGYKFRKDIQHNIYGIS